MDIAIYILLGATSVVGLAFIVERAWSLRWRKVVPPEITASLAACRTRSDVKALCRVCQQKPSPLGRLVLLAAGHLEWPKGENVDSLQTAARHEIVRLERGLVVLEIIIGIAPLLGLVGTIAGMMMLFGKLGQTGLNDASALAHGIALILNATLFGLLIAIPSVIFWSYFSKKVEVFAVEMEALCDEFIRRQYREIATGDEEEETPAAPNAARRKPDAKRHAPDPQSETQETD